MALFSRDSIRIYTFYALTETDRPDILEHIEVVENNTDFSVFFLHFLWPISKAMPLLSLLHIAAIISTISTNIYLINILRMPQFVPLVSMSYALFLLSIAAFGNNWKEYLLIRKGYKEVARVCAVNRARALEFFFNGDVN